MCIIFGLKVNCYNDGSFDGYYSSDNSPWLELPTENAEGEIQCLSVERQKRIKRMLLEIANSINV